MNIPTRTVWSSSINGWKIVTHYPENLINYANNYISIGIIYPGIICSKSGNYVEICIEKDEVILSRDLFGAIPIYYSIEEKTISTCINHIIPKQKLCNSDLHSYIQHGIITSRYTGYQNINKLLPNERIRIAGGQIRVESKRNYFPAITSDHEHINLNDIIERFIDNLPLISKEDGIRLLHTSGGNDSTLILSLLDKLTGEKQRTLCSSFGHTDWRSDLDDLTWAKYVVKQTNFDFMSIELNKKNFYYHHIQLINRCRSLLHTYSAAFYSQIKNNSIKNNVEYIINGSGPDECIIGTEKESIENIREKKLEDNSISGMIALLKQTRDYCKLPSSYVRELFSQHEYDEKDPIKELALIGFDKNISYANNQRRFHSLFILQDHIHTITASSNFKPVFFPFLTNDFFAYAFGSKYEWLNKNNIYKFQVKKALSFFVDNKIVYRKKVAFQSPSRAYFTPGSLFYKKLQRMVSANASNRFETNAVNLSLQERLNHKYSNKARYDFLEWNIYNILLLDSISQS